MLFLTFLQRIKLGFQGFLPTILPGDALRTQRATP